MIHLLWWLVQPCWLHNTIKSRAPIKPSQRSKYSMDGINVNMDKSVDNVVNAYCSSCPVYHRTGRLDTSDENEFVNHYRVYRSTRRWPLSVAQHSQFVQGSLAWRTRSYQSRHHQSNWIWNNELLGNIYLIHTRKHKSKPYVANVQLYQKENIWFWSIWPNP